MAKNMIIRNYELTGRADLEKGSFRGVFLTDFHNSTEDKIFECLEQIKPDLVLVGGDVLVGKPGYDTRPAADFIRTLAERYPVWYADGNHEDRVSRNREVYGTMGMLYDQEIARTKAVRLRNQRADLTVHGVPVTIFGLSCPPDYYKKQIRRKQGMEKVLWDTFGEVPKDRYTILLAHNPRYTREYLSWGADLTLCGHYHGGVFRLNQRRGLITPDFQLFSGYCGGIRSQGSSSVIVSAGLGEHTVPIRIHNPREITAFSVQTGSRQNLAPEC